MRFRPIELFLRHDVVRSLVKNVCARPAVALTRYGERAPLPDTLTRRSPCYPPCRYDPADVSSIGPSRPGATVRAASEAPRPYPTGWVWQPKSLSNRLACQPSSLKRAKAGADDRD
jgi:hypothetical protein